MPKLVFFGCGGVGCAFLELLTIIPLKNISYILIFDPRDISCEPIIKNMGDKIKHIKVEIGKNNFFPILSKYVESKDIIVDISYNIYFKPVVKWCLKNKVIYINTSSERWSFENEHILENKKENYKRTIFYSHSEARNISKKGSTIILEHGMNPGLISHFVKLGIKNVAEQVLKAAEENKIIVSDLSSAYNSLNFPLLAYLLGLETIHCSEKDTQKSVLTREKETFFNTWGAYSFYSESVDPVQICLGTHEKRFPNACYLKNFPCHAYLSTRGMDMKLKSYVPLFGEINGYVIPHGENESISKSLTLWEKNKIKYCPSQYYVYSPCDEAKQSLEEVRVKEYKMLETQKALRGQNIAEGYDAVGALLIFKNNPVQKIIFGKKTEPECFWSGTILDIIEARRLGFKYAGPTVIQVAISLYCALQWAINNPNEGVVFPEHLPFQQILKESSPFLGKIFTDWVPFYPKTTQITSFQI